MAENKLFSKLIFNFFKKYSIPEIKNNFDLGEPGKIIVIRQHNQLGDLLAGIPLFRAIKEKYPEVHLTVVASPSNYQGLSKNKFIDRLFIFDKKQLINPSYFNELHKLLKEKYDVAIVPVTVSISFTSNLLARLADAKIRIGAQSLDGKVNKSDFFFDRRVNIDWRKYPDQNIYERSLDLVRPFGITTKNLRPEISFDEEDSKFADKFISTEIKLNKGEHLIGLHIGAGKPQNRWSLLKFADLIERLNKEYPSKFFITGSHSDHEEISFIKGKLKIHVAFFLDHSISQIAALISKSDLFISNDTGIMHVAGATDVAQVSVFGPTNPFAWAPLGENKKIVKRSDFIDDVSVDEVFENCKILLDKVPVVH
jgi:heptosyltransferase-2